MNKVPLIYLDNCCFNRPFDDKTVFKNYLEAEAKLRLQWQIKNRQLELVWSFILELENEENPFSAIREHVLSWKEIASVHVFWDAAVQEKSKYIQDSLNIKPKDAYHLACAIKGNADLFLTTDRKFLNRIRNIEKPACLNPLEWFERGAL